MVVQGRDGVRPLKIEKKLIRAGRGLLLLVAGVMVLGGCVSKGRFETMVKERDSALAEMDTTAAERDALAAERDLLAAERSDLIKGMGDLHQQVEQVAAQKAQAAKEAELARAELARQQAVFDSLEQTFAKEQQQNQVKIEMLKSGVKVNLDNEILFPSGSSTLNETGVDVLKRAAAELKKSPYQTLIAGYTDNVPISAKLLERYPSNWELAGARAASVVRLLEEQGVPSAQMLAISFGENSPVDSNDTPEGRKKNRRIEILLRPVAIQMR